MPSYDSERSGAHRPHRSVLRDLLPAAVVVVALLVVVTALVQLKDTALGGASTAATTGPQPGQDAQSAAPTSPTKPAPATQPAETPTTKAAGTVDRSVSVGVYNGTTTSGLASRVSARLRTERWQARAVGNFRDRTVPTTVFFASADQEATAQAVAKSLGGDPAVQQSNDFDTVGISVVIGSDYTEQ